MKRINKVIFGIIICTLMILRANYASAAPLKNVPVELNQYNGETIKCYATGDEYLHCFHDVNGYVILKDSYNRYVYAENQNGLPVPSQILVNSVLKMPSNLAKLKDVKISEELIKEKQKVKSDNGKLFLTSKKSYPTTGTLNNIVAFIKFQDDANFSEPISYFSGQFNDNAVSMKRYFLEASYNKLTINSYFYPSSSNDAVVAYTDSHPRGYYQPYSSDNLIGYSTLNESYSREQILIRNAASSISSQVPTSINLDNNNDGIIDSLVFVVKGGTGAWADLLWPHKWNLQSAYVDNVYINGKKVVDYNFQINDFLKSAGVGVLCHEMFHTLGAPDLYHYTSYYQYLSPVGYWDIMEYATRQHMGAYMKYRYGKWIGNIPEITGGTYTLNPLTSANKNAYKIKIPGNSSEYLVLEYRKQMGNFDSQLPGSGLLVYRINTSMDGQGNEEGPPDEVYIFRPDGSSTSNGNINSANLSASAGRSKSDGIINIVDSNGKKIDIKITNIVENESNISFTVGMPADPPTFNFTSGTYLGTQTLVMSSSNKLGTIRYTVNGSEPTETSAKYTAPIKISKSSVVKGKVFLNGVGSKTTSAAINIQSVLQSSHPYGNNYNKPWIVNAPDNVKKVYLTFDELTEVQKGYDYIYIKDKNGKNIAGSPFTGTALKGKTISVNGNKAVVTLISNSSVTKYGFKIKNIKYDYPYVGYYQNSIDGNLLKISGWGIYKKSISKFEVYIDNKLYGSGTRYSKSDLKTKYPYTDISAAGFNFKLDIRTLTNGKHNVRVIAKGSDGTSYSLGTKAVTVNSAYKRYIGNFENSTKLNSFTYKFSGWAAYGKAISKVELVESSVVLGKAKRIQRDDISRVYQNYYTVNSGYELYFDTRTVKNGTHKLSIKATAIDGKSYIIGTKTITVNDAYMAFKGSVDNFSKINSSTYKIDGWGIYGKSIARVDILVDNKIRGQATRSERKDIASKYPKYYTVNSGFQYYLKISNLAKGSHTVKIRLVGVDGKIYVLKEVKIYKS